MIERFEPKQYSPEEIGDAALIIHPKAKGYNIKEEEIAQVFEKGSNFTQLKTPLVDEWGNEFWDSEGYYMACRTQDPAIKQAIAFLSTGWGLSTKARNLFPLEQDEDKRIEYMRKTLKLKYDTNPDLKELLMQTKPREIIEYTYRGDTLFGIDQETLS
jgi:predicted NAD-dependent protein-ADP-ribosyltransferase YbiA (DUF1768 family)